MITTLSNIINSLFVQIRSLFFDYTWDDLLELVVNLDMAVRKNLPDVPHVTAFFLESSGGGMVAFKQKLFYKVDGKWFEDTVSREFSKDILPADIRSRLEKSRGEIDVTADIEAELGESE